MKGLFAFKLPELTNKLLRVKLSRNNAYPTKLLYSPSLGPFWYYNENTPAILKDCSDYRFNRIKIGIDYVSTIELDLSDPEIVNWKDICYSIEYLNYKFAHKDINTEFFSKTKAGDRVLFANGETGVIIEYISSNEVKSSIPRSNTVKIKIKLDDTSKCPNYNSEGHVWQNMSDGKYSGWRPMDHLEWAIVDIVK